MLVVKTYLAPSKIHGIGLFAGEFIPKDKMIFLYETTFTKVLSVEDLVKWKGNPHAEELIRKHVWMRDGQYIISFGDDTFTNHSDHPNTYSIEGCTFASKDIAEGEEITDNYNEFYEQGADFEKGIKCLKGKESNVLQHDSVRADDPGLCAEV